jgi:sugar lactone lactonase YvrE
MGPQFAEPGSARPSNWRAALAFSVAAAAWLTLAPTRVEPVKWEGPGRRPSRRFGCYAPNGLLDRVERFERVAGESGPESAAADALGRLHAGFDSGAIVRFGIDGGTPEIIARTDGRPLGLRFHPDGSLLIADAVRGLLRLKPGASQVEVLVSEFARAPLTFADDLDITHEGRFVYFSQATTKYGWPDQILDLLEHGAHGRVFRYDLATGETTLIAEQLNFPNGITLGPGDSFLLITETGSARVLRLWLRGPRAGELEVFADRLPGYPDNVRFDGLDTFWVALPSGRNALLDGTAGLPALRRVMGRLIEHLVPLDRLLPDVAMVLGLDLHGIPVAFADGSGPGSYGFITQALPLGEHLILSSLHANTLARTSTRRIGFRQDRG